jgi:hypothetical protein
VANV